MARAAASVLGRMRRLPRLLPLLTVLAAGACQPVFLTERGGLTTSVGRFRLEYAPGDAEGAAMVRRAVEAAAPRLRRWGDFEAPPRITVLAHHDALEEATGKEGWPWLRAWARRDEVLVQSPTTWFEGGATQAQTNELLLHELTHSLMYQLAAPGDDARKKGIPAWFREGMASVTADQGYRRGTLHELARALRAERGDPLGGGEGLWREESAAVYTTAHHAFGFLLERIGDRGVRRLLAAMRRGADFDAAFLEIAGGPRAAFEEDFRRYVLSQTWRGAGWRGREAGSAEAPSDRP